MGDFIRVGENLVRHSNGTIYLRGRVGGKLVFRSLRTGDVRVAKLGRDAMLARMRSVAATSAKGGAAPRMLHQVAAMVAARMDQPHLKPRSREYYAEVAKILRATLPAIPAGDWTPNKAADWWRAVSKTYAPQRANNILAMAKHIGAAIVEHSLSAIDPTLKLRRLRIPRRTLAVPSLEQVYAISRHIEEARKGSWRESSAIILFLAFSGCRHGEARAVCWEDVSGEWLTITGGEGGTKGGEVRRVPISEPLRAAIDLMRYPGAAGSIWSMGSPRRALGSACEALGLPHLRIHDLRHFFATWCIESGVDVPTVSKWLGHKDGGALAMRVYGHLRDEHSIESAKKLSSQPNKNR